MTCSNSIDVCKFGVFKMLLQHCCLWTTQKVPTTTKFTSVPRKMLRVNADERLSARCLSGSFQHLISPHDGRVCHRSDQRLIRPYTVQGLLAEFGDLISMTAK